MRRSQEALGGPHWLPGCTGVRGRRGMGVLSPAMQGGTSTLSRSRERRIPGAAGSELN